MTENIRLKIYIDGAARGNPGPAGIGVVVMNSEGHILREIKEYIGPATNNIAEYRAAVKALQIASRLGGEKLDIFCDSELIVRQIKGEYKVKDEKLRDLCKEVKALEKKFQEVNIELVPRERNKQADKLANIAINLGTL